MIVVALQGLKRASVITCRKSAPQYYSSRVLICLHSLQTTPQIKICQTWCRRWRWWRWSGNTKTSSTCSERAHRTVRPWGFAEGAVSTIINHVLEVTLCSVLLQVLCTSWWNTPLKATWGSTCGRGGRRAWTTPSTPVKSPTSSSPSKTWCPAPTRSPEAWSTSPRRRSAAVTPCHWNADTVQFDWAELLRVGAGTLGGNSDAQMISFILKEIKRRGQSSNMRML